MDSIKFYGSPVLCAAFNYPTLHKSGTLVIKEDYITTNNWFATLTSSEKPSYTFYPSQFSLSNGFYTVWVNNFATVTDYSTYVLHITQSGSTLQLSDNLLGASGSSLSFDDSISGIANVNFLSNTILCFTGNSPPNNTTKIVIALVVVVVIGLAIGGYLLYKKNHKKL